MQTNKQVEALNTPRTWLPLNDTWVPSKAIWSLVEGEWKASSHNQR